MSSSAAHRAFNTLADLGHARHHHVTSTPRVDWEHVHRNTETPELDLRYTGIRDVALYGRISQSNVNGIDKDTSAYNPLTSISGTTANNHDRERHTDYTVGANQLADLAISHAPRGNISARDTGITASAMA